MSLNLLFLLHKKLVFQKKVTKSKFVTKFTVTKSEVDCTYLNVQNTASEKQASLASLSLGSKA